MRVTEVEMAALAASHDRATAAGHLDALGNAIFPLCRHNDVAKERGTPSSPEQYGDTGNR